MREKRPYGTWPSPITPASMAAALGLSQPQFDSDGQTIGWLEGRSDRGVLVVQDVSGEAPRDLTGEVSVRAMVGYGGGDFTLAHGSAWFVGQADQRIYRQPIAGGPAQPITPGFGEASTPVVSPDGRFVAYVHTYGGEDCIAIADAEGRCWPQRFASGRTFYMQPTWSPDGSRLAWVEWDHPNMPWDGTEILAGEVVTDGALPRLGATTVIAGGADISAVEPNFTPDSRSLVYASDEPGWWQLYRRDVNADTEPVRLTNEAAEYSQPAWQQATRSMTVLDDGTVVARRRHEGRDTLVAISEGGPNREIGALSDQYATINGLNSASGGGRVAFVAGAPTTPARVVSIDLSGEHGPFVHRRASGETIPREALSAARAVSWETGSGVFAHGIFYPPASERFESDGEPPLVVLVHGGPTSDTALDWSPNAQFLATRGFAVLSVNYRGSTGYGKVYRDALRGNWGIHDVEDCRSGAQAMADQGLAAGDRLVIMGGSAGGYTVLKSLVDYPGLYRAGVCLFGVSNLFTLASDTHKFEERYLDSMIGPLPEAAHLYRDRSPIFHAEAIVDPVAVFQGDIDRVVPREQSDSIVASLAARGVRHEYHVYEGEGHGWRKSETIEEYYTALERFLVQYVVYA